MSVVQERADFTNFRIWVSLEGLSEGDRISFPSEKYDDEYVVFISPERLNTIKRLNKSSIWNFERNLIDYVPHMLVPIKKQTYQRDSYDSEIRKRFQEFDSLLKKYE